METPNSPGTAGPAGHGPPDKHSDWQRLYDRGTEALAADEHGRAIAAFGEAVLLRPAHVGTHVALGRCLQRLGRTEAARRIYRHAVRIGSVPAAEAEAEEALGALPPEPEVAHPFQDGQVVRSPDNSYRVLDRMMGGCGAVSVVEPEGRSSFFDRIGYRRYALKTFNVPHPWSKESQERFANEAITWLLLDRHPHIVTAIWVERVEELPCILLEFVAGGDLAAELEKGHFDLERTLRLGLQFCDAMDHAARTRGVVHGDVKAANCLLAPDGSVKLTDFGMSQAFGPAQLAGEGLSDLAAEVRAMYSPSGGTAGYRAPEQVGAGARIDVRTDIFGFGVLLYQMATGDLPVSGTIAAKHISAKADSDGLPESLREVILACVEREPKQRPQNFRVLRGELKNIYEDITGEEAPAPAAALPGDVDLYIRRGAALDELGRHEEALEYLDSALEAAPGDGWALLNKSLTLINLERPDEALVCLDEALERYPGYAQAQHAKARLLAALGREPNPQPADPAGAASVEPGVEPGVDRVAAVWQALGGDGGADEYFGNVLELIDLALEDEPDSTLLWTYKIGMLVMTGRTNDAARFLRQAEARGIEPGDGAFRALSGRGLAREHRGRNEQPSRNEHREPTGIDLAHAIAAIEAVAGNAESIEPVHLLLAICKLADSGAAVAISRASADGPDLRRELAVLRDRFRRSGLNVTGFRRRLRKVAAYSHGPARGSEIHRNRESRHAFRRAEELAAGTGTDLSDLLRAVLESPSRPWIAVAAETGDQGRLEQLMR